MEGIYTTSELCNLLGVTNVRVIKNFNNNKSSFVEGIHYFLLTGHDINERLSELGISPVSAMVRKIYIWTQRGAALIAQSTNTKDSDSFLESIGVSRSVKGYAERIAITTIEQVLGVTIERQFCVLNYRVDGYCKENNTVYEIDEFHHERQTEFDTNRQLRIEEAIGCKFVRVKV